MHLFLANLWCCLELIVYGFNFVDFLLCRFFCFVNFAIFLISLLIVNLLQFPEHSLLFQLFLFIIIFLLFFIYIYIWLIIIFVIKFFIFLFILLQNQPPLQSYSQQMNQFGHLIPPILHQRTTTRINQHPSLKPQCVLIHCLHNIPQKILTFCTFYLKHVHLKERMVTFY